MMSSEVDINFEWVPFFKELASKILAYEKNQGDLIGYLIKAGVEVGFNDQNPKGSTFLLEEIDPFTFFSLVLKHSNSSKRFQIFNSLKSILDLKAEAPNSYYGVPNSDPRNAWFFGYKYERDDGDISKLWALHKEALLGEISDGSLEDALKIKGVGLAKLTHGLFWVNPEKYFPIDKPTKTYLEKLGMGSDLTKNSEYKSICQALISTDIPLYEHSFLAWKDMNTLNEVKSAKTTNSGDKLPMRYPLNKILFGPPGTGKTYSTMRLAVNICGGESISDENLAQEYIRLKKANRISFITFHQSFSYEDFVEGIRPSISDTNNSNAIVYRVEDGIFKKVCNLAAASHHSTSNSKSIDLKDKRVFKMSLGNSQDSSEDSIYEDCIRNNYILLGWGSGVDYSNCNTLSSIEEKYKREKNPEAKKQDFNITSVHYLKNEMQIGDLVIISDGNLKFRAIARITGPYKFIERDDDYVQMRPVEWILKLDESLPVESILTKRFSQMAIYLPDPQSIKWDAIEQFTNPVKQNYVLIIDEINRANISKVFGELITLIEDNKRAKKDGAVISATLPYSQKEFSVPDNLFIIGTMNTADRSIALLDTALRRRFEFEELMPDPNLLNSIGNVDLGKILVSINQRIEHLYDRDHTIGHAYLMNIHTMEELALCFKNRIIPLLQEYFYDDWENIKRVLNDRAGYFISETSSSIEDLEDTKKIYSVNNTFIEEAFLNIYR